MFYLGVVADAVQGPSAELQVLQQGAHLVLVLFEGVVEERHSLSQKHLHKHPPVLQSQQYSSDFLPDYTCTRKQNHQHCLELFGRISDNDHFFQSFRDASQTYIFTAE